MIQRRKTELGVYGVWCMVYGVWCMVCMVCVVWFVWCVVYGVYGMYSVWCMECIGCGVCYVWCVCNGVDVYVYVYVYVLGYCVGVFHSNANDYTCRLFAGLSGEGVMANEVCDVCVLCDM